MTNFHDPAVIAQESLIITKLWHTVSGLYIWEFCTTLEYEWNVIRRHLPYRWTIWIYSLARLAALLGVILGFVMMDITIPIKCQAGFSFVIVSSFLSMSASSLLIVLRIIAIWKRNRVVVAAAITMWVVNVAFLVQGAARLRATWIPAALKCGALNTDTSELNLMAFLVTDIALLLIMLIGLLHLRLHGGGTFGLTKLLWKQGVIWLLIATVAEVPPVVFLILNLNDPLNIMFQQPSWITMAIASTRMHRSLVDFTYESTDIVHQTEVAVYVVSGQHPTLQAGNNDSRVTNTNEQPHENPDGLSRDEDLDHGV